MSLAKIVIRQRREQVVQCMIARPHRSPQFAEPGSVGIVNRIKQLFFKRHRFALARPTMRTERTNLVQQNQRHTDDVGNDPNRIQGFATGDPSANQKPHTPSETEYLLKHDQAAREPMFIVMRQRWSLIRFMNAPMTRRGCAA